MATIRPQSIYQKLAVERNWFKYFILRQITLKPKLFIKLSPKTHSHIATVNTALELLRESIDKDWKETKKRYKEAEKKEEKKKKALEARVNPMSGL